MKEMFIFESILTTFEASVIFSGSQGSSGNWLEPKTKPPFEFQTKLSVSKSVIRTETFKTFKATFYMKNLSTAYRHIFDFFVRYARNKSLSLITT